MNEEKYKKVIESIHDFNTKYLNNKETYCLCGGKLTLGIDGSTEFDHPYLILTCNTKEPIHEERVKKPWPTDSVSKKEANKKHNKKLFVATIEDVDSYSKYNVLINNFTDLWHYMKQETIWYREKHLNGLLWGWDGKCVTKKGGGVK